MRSRNWLLGVFAVLATFCIYRWITTSGALVASSETRISTKKSIDRASIKDEVQDRLQPKQLFKAQDLSVSDKPESISVSSLKLNTANFRNFVNRCFQGEPCELQENPLDMYNEFKQRNEREANDLLIAYLRRNLKNKDFASRYKEALKKMIDDFYPIEEKQFQEAAYYNYLGDLDKSLALYLDLEKKGLSKSALRQAPKLNIANTLYDLGRRSEALPYYQAARFDYLSGKEQSEVPSQGEMIQYIEERIESCKVQ